MSGGAFNYDQYKFKQMAESIQYELDNQGKEKPKEELWCQADYYEKYPEERFNHTYPKEVQERLKEAVKIFNKAYIYAQRIDWMLSGDDGEESFLRRLKKDLDENNHLH